MGQTSHITGKDLVSFLRDGALFLLAVLLVVAPVRFNTMLAKALWKAASVALNGSPPSFSLTVPWRTRE